MSSSPSYLGDGLRDGVQHAGAGSNDKRLLHVLLLRELVGLPLELHHCLLSHLDVHSRRDAGRLASGESRLDALQVLGLDGRSVQFRL